MAVLATEKEEKMIEALAAEAEIRLEEDDERKDLKEKRAIIKQTFYGGSQKTKHVFPKGKHL